MNAISLTIGGVTKTIQASGFTYCTLHLKTRAPSTLILDRGGDLPEHGPVIAYGTPIVMQVSMGDGSTYFWQGKRCDFNGEAHPDAPKTSYQFEDVWGALSRTVFQHFWQMSDGVSGVANTYFSAINLFQDIHAGPDTAWAYLTADNQIKQIVEFAQEQCGLPVQVGVVDPVWNMPVCAVKAITCAEALQTVMKPMPDMVTNMDHSTTPSTINFRARKNCEPITLPYASTDANGRSHKLTQIKPRPDLQVPSVTIQYNITGTIDGREYNNTSVDAYPPGATGLAENALVFPVNLRGPSRNDVEATLVTEAVDPTTAVFWLEHKPDLDDAKIALPGTATRGVAIVDTSINTGAADGISILDSAGGAVSLADFPYKLISGQPTEWMTAPDGVDEIDAIEVTIRATLKYDKLQIAGIAVADQKLNAHVVETRIRLVNAPLGTTKYSTTGSSDSGDPIPLFLAYYMWCSINNVVVNYVGGIADPPAHPPLLNNPDNFQWEGEHEIVENNIYSIITPANVLNLSGGDPDWESMNAVIYGVDIDFFQGRTAINFGPFKHLQAAAYFEMVMAFRYRQVWENPNLRNTGQAGSAGATDLGGDSPKENTTEQVPEQGQHTTQSSPDDSGNIIKIQADALNNGGQILVQKFDNTGAVVDVAPIVQLSNDDLGTINNAGLIGRVANWRKFTICDSAGNVLTALFAATEPE